MKKIVYILFVLLISFQQLIAQNFNAFKENVLPQYVQYFNSAELTNQGLLSFNATEKYVSLSTIEKKSVMDLIAGSWKASLILIKYNFEKEMWSWNSQKGEAVYLDKWNFDYPITNKLNGELEKTSLHPWFVYAGGNYNMDSNKNGSLSINCNIGFFLLYERWNMGMSSSITSAGNAQSEGTTTSGSFGLMSKYYYPIKKLHISPNAGLDYSVFSYGSSMSDEDNVSRNTSVLLGLSWFVPSGTIDFGLKIGETTSATFGYTYIPKMRMKR